MDTSTIFLKFGISCVLGMLIGLEREYSQKGEEPFAGVRTFALVSMLGTMAAMLSENNPWVLPAGFLVFGSLVAIGYYVSTLDRRDFGATTEVASLVVFAIGAAVYSQKMEVVVALAIATTVILSGKEPLHQLAQKIEPRDIVATLKFAIVTFIVLPVLPQQTYGPFNAFNPYKTWFMIVLVSGISFAGYVAVKVVGAQKGIGLTAALGALVSSTAVTATFSKKSKEQPDLSSYFAMAVTLASAIMFVRVMAEIFAVNRVLLMSAVVPLGAMAVTGIAYCAYLYFGPKGEVQTTQKFSNPFELMEAVKFGVIYAAIVFLIKAVKHYIPGDAGIYLVSAVSGLTDVDAITLSICESAKTGLATGTAVKAITIAVISNTAVKGFLAYSMGTKQLGTRVGLGFGLACVVGIVAMFFVS